MKVNTAQGTPLIKFSNRKDFNKKIIALAKSFEELGLITSQEVKELERKTN